MATPTHTTSSRPTTPNPHFEPDEGWKNNLRQRIEITHKPAAERLKRELSERLKSLSPSEASKAQADYDYAMAALRRTANDQYRQLLERARQELRWTAGEKTDERWSETLMKEQQTLLDTYKKGAMAKANQPEVTRDDERRQPSDRASLPAESTAGDRMRRPSNHLTEPIPERSPSALPSLEDREPRPYFSTSPFASRMTTLPDTTTTRPTTPNPEFEPDDEWKTNLRQRIEVTLKPTAEKLQREFNGKLKGLSPTEASKAQTEYDDSMAELRRTAQQQYHQLLERERRERRWNTGGKADEKRTGILAKEKEALLDAYKAGTIPKTNQPGAIRDEERNRSPPLSKVAERVSFPSESTAKDRMRMPPKIVTQLVSEDSPQAQLPLEDREPQFYSSTGNWSRRSDGRGRSPDPGFPSRHTPGMWKPTPHENTSSTMPSASESPLKSGVTWTSASSQLASSRASTRPTSRASSQGPASVHTPTKFASDAPTPDTSPYQTTSISPEEWEKRRQQEELFRREQERIELERRRRPKTLSQREAIILFAEHDWQWERLKALDDPGWDNLPWPVFEKPTEPEELTSIAINAYVLSPHHPTDKSKTTRDRVKNHIKKWHLDRFETKVLRKVREEEREKVREGARSVALALNEMLTRANTSAGFDEPRQMEKENSKNDDVLPKGKEELGRKEDELEKREAELERREVELMAKEERLRQEEVNRLAREEEERRRVRKALREVRDRGGVLI